MTRDYFVNKIKRARTPKTIGRAEMELKKFDGFFDKLKKDMTIYQCIGDHDFDFQVESWNKEEGVLNCTIKGDPKTFRTFNYGEDWGMNIPKKTDIL